MSTADFKSKSLASYPDTSALTKAGGAIGHMYDRAVIHMTDRDVRA